MSGLIIPFTDRRRIVESYLHDLVVNVRRIELTPIHAEAAPPEDTGIDWVLVRDLDRLHRIVNDRQQILNVITLSICAAFVVFGCITGVIAGAPWSATCAIIIGLLGGPLSLWAALTLYHRQQ